MYFNSENLKPIIQNMCTYCVVGQNSTVTCNITIKCVAYYNHLIFCAESKTIQIIISPASATW